MTKLFSYGSNLSSAERGCVGLATGTQVFDLLRGYRFEFAKESKSPEGGSRATVTPAAGRVVVGGIMEVDDEGFEALRRKEGGYESIEVEVELVDEGIRVPALTFVAKTARYRPDLLPPRDYVDKVLAGIGELGPVGAAGELAWRQAALTPPPRTMPRHGLDPERGWSGLVALDSLLVRLAKGTVPGDGYDEAALRALLASMVKGQREALDRYPAGSFALIGHDGFDGDIRFDLVVRASAVAVAILSLAETRLPELAAGMPGLGEALRRGLDFLAQTSLAGAGYDAASGSAMLVHTLADGGIPERLATEPGLSPGLFGRLRALRHDFAAMFPEAPSRPGWGALAKWEVEEVTGRLRVGSDG